METSIKILIAEDDETIGFIMQSALKSMGSNIIIELAPNGALALEKAIDFAPDVFLLDWMMPTLDGLEVTKELRKMAAFAHTPIIMVTSAVPNENNLTVAFEAGVTDYIAKPFNKVELRLRVGASIKIVLAYQELMLARLKAEHVNRELKSANRHLEILYKGLESELELQKDYNDTLKNAMEMVKLAKDELASLYTKKLTSRP